MSFAVPSTRPSSVTSSISRRGSRATCYGIDWRPGAIDVAIDGRVVRHLDQAPDDPLQLELGVFDFPAKATGQDDDSQPELVVSHIRARPPAGA
jgi:hypothetical protein